MIGYIYKIINIKNNKVYVGQTLNMQDRKWKHLSALRNNKHHSHKLQRAYNKYGEKNFIWEYNKVIIDTPQELDLLEMQTIQDADSYYNGYNETLGGNGHKVLFDYYTIILLFNVLQRYDGVNRYIAKQLHCDHSVIDSIKNNTSLKECQYDEQNLHQFILRLNLSNNNLKQKYQKHNNKKLTLENVLEILSVITAMNNYEKTMCQIFNISSKTIYRLKRKLIYKQYCAQFDTLSTTEKQQLAQKTMIKYHITNVFAKRKRNGVKNPLTQTQVNDILDHVGTKSMAAIARDLNISVDRVRAVAHHKSYTDLINNYFLNKY